MATVEVPDYDDLPPVEGGKDTGSWVCYGLAGAITVAMPVIPWLYLRRLDEVMQLPSRFG